MDEEWVAAEKERHAASDATSGVPWVSSNDVLTSWFLRQGGYSYGFMAINLRRKLAGLTDESAGNYEGAIQFWPEEFRQAAGIRRSLQPPNMFQAGRQDVPGFWRSLRSHFGVATNWSSLQSELHLPGCEHGVVRLCEQEEKHKYPCQHTSLHPRS